MISSHDPLTELEQTRIWHEFNPDGRQYNYKMCEYKRENLEHKHALVVPNWVFRRLPSIPCTPRLALMKARPTKVNAFVQAGSLRALEMLGCPAFQNAMALAMVRRVWMNVPAMSHIRLCDPTRSPIRPTNAPRLKLIKEHRACWSALWKVWSWNLGAPSNRRASARANYERVEDKMGNLRQASI